MPEPFPFDPLRQRYPLPALSPLRPGRHGELLQPPGGRGHDVRLDLNIPSFGRGQMIVRLENGVLAGATGSRTDSSIACC